MKNRENNTKNFKLSGLVTGLLSFCTAGISLYLINQNNKILKQLKPSKQEKLEVDRKEEKKEVPMAIHRYVYNDEDLPVKRRFLTG